MVVKMIQDDKLTGITSNIQLFQEKYLEADNKLLHEADFKKAELKEIVKFRTNFKIKDFPRRDRK